MVSLAREKSQALVSNGMADRTAPEPATVTRLVPRPTAVQRNWLARGLAQPGGKLPLFDDRGQRISPRTIQSCIEQGWAEPWFANPLKPDWLVCKLTERGRNAIAPTE
jgi:hypothetical protein